MGASVEDFVEALEGLLAGGVPNLQLDDLVFDFDEKRAELYAYGDFVVLFELVFHETREDARLAHAWEQLAARRERGLLVSPMRMTLKRQSCLESVLSWITSWRSEVVSSIFCFYL